MMKGLMDDERLDDVWRRLKRIFAARCTLHTALHHSMKSFKKSLFFFFDEAQVHTIAVAVAVPFFFLSLEC